MAVVNLKQDGNIFDYLYSLHQLNQDNDENVSFSDVDIICIDGKVNAHSVVLISRSSLFKEYFFSLTPSEKSHITLYLPGYKVRHVIPAVHFLYTGEAIVSAKKRETIYKILQDLNIDTSRISSSYSSNNEKFKTDINHYLFDDDDDLAILNELNNDQEQEQELISSQPIIPQTKIPEIVQMEIQPSSSSLLLQKQQQSSSSILIEKNYNTASSASTSSVNENANTNISHSYPNNKPPRPQYKSRAIRVENRTTSGIKIVDDNDDEGENITTSQPSPQPSQSSNIPSNNNDTFPQPASITKQARQSCPTRALRVVRSSLDGLKVIQADDEKQEQPSSLLNKIARQEMQAKALKVVRKPGEGIKVVDQHETKNDSPLMKTPSSSTSSSSSSRKKSNQVSSAITFIKVGAGIKVIRTSTTAAPIATTTSSSSATNYQIPIATTTSSSTTNSQIPRKEAQKQNVLRRKHSLLMSDSEAESSSKRKALESESDSDSSEFFPSDFDKDYYEEILKTQPNEKLILRECRVVLTKLLPEDEDKYQAKLIALQSQLLSNPNNNQEESENGDVEMAENIVIPEEILEPINPSNSNANTTLRSQKMTTSTNDKSYMNVYDININSTTTSANENTSESTATDVIDNPSPISLSEQRQRSPVNAEGELDTSISNIQQVVEEEGEEVEQMEEDITTLISSNDLVSHDQTTMSIEITQCINSEENQNSTMNIYPNDTENNTLVLVAPSTTSDSQSFQSVEHSNTLETPDDTPRNNDNTIVANTSSSTTNLDNVSFQMVFSESTLVDLRDEEAESPTSSNPLPSHTVIPNNNGAHTMTNNYNGTNQSSPSINNVNNVSTNPFVVQSNNSIIRTTNNDSNAMINNNHSSPNDYPSVGLYFGGIFPVPIPHTNNHIQLPYQTDAPMNSYFTGQYQQEQIFTPPQQESQVCPPASTSTSTRSNTHSCFECGETFTKQSSLDGHICFGPT